MDFSINIGDLVDIGELEDPKFSFLSNKQGLVTQILDTPARRNRGYILKVIGIDFEEKEWFVDCKYVKKH